MENELQGKLVEILSSIQAATGKASDFAVEQLPDIAQSYVMYGRAISVLHFVAIVAVVVGSALVFRWAWVKPWYSQYSWDEGKNHRHETNIMTLVLSGIATFAATIFLIPIASSCALVWFAPKVWLLKELAQLVK